MEQKLHGVYPTMITPYKKDGTVDLDGVEKLVKWYLDKKCDGIFATCQSSEIFYLSLEEKTAILRRVMKTVKEYATYPVKVVASGATSDSLDEQINEMGTLAQEEPYATVILTNRLATEDESDDVWIANAEKLLVALPKDMKLGLYECPYPYKRLLTDKTLDFIIKTGRFSFIKDTCCDPVLLKHRCEKLKNTCVSLFNANAQTLLYSLQNGASGYSGVMANFHPEFYVWLCNHPTSEQAEYVSNELSMYASIEFFCYPVCAKYHFNLVGVEMERYSRSKDEKLFTPYETHVVNQLFRLEEELRGKIPFEE
jgi:4-hydroxy-tetrahydrodipicolinate synthase